MENEKTSKPIATIASKLLKATRKSKLKLKEIKQVAASALTQAPDKKD